MRPGTELINQLCPDPALMGDVITLLHDHFHQVHAHGRLVSFAKSPGSVDLTVRYERGNVISMTAGASLDVGSYEEILSRIQREVFRSPGDVIARTCLFSRLPVRGFFRYADDFQLIPAPDSAPRKGFMGVPQPFLLEYRLCTSCNKLVEVQRRQRRIAELVDVLNAIGNCRVWRISPVMQWRWVEVDNSPEPIQCCPESYRLPDEEGGDRSQWSEITVMDEIPQSTAGPDFFRALKSHFDCFGLPKGATDLVTAVTRLSDRRLKQFQRASYWLRFAEATSPASESAAFLGLVNVIECLCPPDSTLGPTAKFKRFLNEYLPPSAELQSTVSNLYDLRSSLTHGSNVFQADLDRMDFMNPDGFTQWLSWRDMVAVVRWVLHNWLLGLRNPAAPDSELTQRK